MTKMALSAGTATVSFAVLLITCVAGQVAVVEQEPEFLQPLENHTVTQGRDIFFTCVVNHLGSYKVAWIKSDSKAILAIHTHMVAHNPRLSVTHNGHNTWKLHVTNVQMNDSGTYMCQINTDPMRSQMGTLDVKIPPDILNDDSPDGGVAPENGSVRLRCKATGTPEPTVMWRREDNKNIVLRYDGGREKQAVKTYDGETLLLNSIQRTDMGAYLCIASNGIPPPVSKRFMVQVHFHPLIKVSNQLVAAPVGSNVDIGCDVEASPRAMNSWYRDTGEKLLESSKHEITEITINDYSLHMNLRILSVQKHDFGGYVCASVNALGKVEGGVRLQELHLAPKTTIVPVSARHDNKSRKKVIHHSKDSKRKRKRPKGEHREEDDDASGEEEEETEHVTTGSWLESRTVQTIIPSASRPPSWILHRNDVENSAPAGVSQDGKVEDSNPQSSWFSPGTDQSECVQASKDKAIPDNEQRAQLEQLLLGVNHTATVSLCACFKCRSGGLRCKRRFSDYFHRCRQTGGTYAKPIIVPNQLAIAAFGRIQVIPRFDESGNVIKARVVYVSWTADHRGTYGATMARFSNL